MLKLITIIPLITFVTPSFTQTTGSEAENFSWGTNFEDCMKNCRYHHRSVLGMPHGSGKGQCWDLCHKAHPSHEKNKGKNTAKAPNKKKSSDKKKSNNKNKSKDKKNK